MEFAKYKKGASKIGYLISSVLFQMLDMIEIILEKKKNQKKKNKIEQNKTKRMVQNG